MNGMTYAADYQQEKVPEQDPGIPDGCRKRPVYESTGMARISRFALVNP
jgi:hypothetical protein